jgi:Flp pilus assembly protein TadD
MIGRADADVLMQAHLYAQAEQDLATLAQAYPDDPDVLYDYAMSAERNHHYDVMENELRRLIAIDPTNPQAYNALGYSLADRDERLSEAQTLIEKASQLAPTDPYIMDSLGWVKYRSGDKEDAVKLLQHAYQIQPNAEIGAHLGEVLWSMGKQDEALQAWRAAHKLEPDNKTLVQTLKRLGVNNL